MKLFVSALAAALILLSCNNGNENTKDIVLHTPGLAATEPVAKAETFTDREGETFRESPGIPHNPGQGAPLPVAPDWNKQIIRNASVSMRVKSFRTAHAGIYQAVENAGGYVAADAERQLGRQVQSEMTIKVPREKFEWLLARITESGDSLIQKNITSEDVTAEYVDTKARIAAREKVRDRYYEFLQKAKNIDEVLKVQKEIGIMQEDIEAASGRVAYIKHQATFSTIYLSFFQPLDMTITDPYTPPGFIQQAITSLKEGWKLVELVLIGLIKIWPIWTLGLAVLYVLRYRTRNRQAVVERGSK